MCLNGTHLYTRRMFCTIAKSFAWLFRMHHVGHKSRIEQSIVCLFFHSILVRLKLSVSLASSNETGLGIWFCLPIQACASALGTERFAKKLTPLTTLSGIWSRASWVWASCTALIVGFGLPVVTPATLRRTKRLAENCTFGTAVSSRGSTTRLVVWFCLPIVTPSTSRRAKLFPQTAAFRATVLIHWRSGHRWPVPTRLVVRFCLPIVAPATAG